MNQEIKTKWLADLRGGKYQQGRSKLRTSDDKFCCLGVLCDAMEPSGWTSSEYEGDDRYYHTQFGGTLPPHLQRQAQLSSEAIGNLTVMNDDGISFAEIADHIEKTL